MAHVKRILEELDVIDDFLFTELMTDKLYKEEFVRYFLKIVLGQEVKIRAVTAQSIATPGSRDKRGIRMDVETEADTFPPGPLVTLKAGQRVADTFPPKPLITSADGQPEAKAFLSKPSVTSAASQSEEDAFSSHPLVSLEDGKTAAGSPATVDIEMQVDSDQTGEGEKYDLRKRSRLYQSLLDVNMLSPGMDYGELGNVMIIICTPYDLFGRDRLKYTFEHICLEESGLSLNDGAKRIFLNTGGHIGSPELKALLRYIVKSTEENAANDDLKEIHKMVTAVKEAKERRETYMWAFEREAMIRDAGIREGTEKGIKEGTEKGTMRVNQLIKALISASRESEIEKFADNLEYQERLFREFGI